MRARWVVVSAAMLLLAGLVGANALAGGGGGTSVRWDIVFVDFEEGTVNEGGNASAHAGDNSKITITGKGTFRPGEPKRVTGGGTYELFDKDGNATGSGTYVVTRLLHWKIAPGEIPLQDNIGNPENRAAGLAVLKVRYSDGERGILVVSCHLNGTPDSVPEGISAAKGFVDYYNIELPPPPGPDDKNRTLFHVRRG